MFELNFNKDKLTQEQLKEIEKNFKQSLNTIKEKITLEFNVLLLKSRTDLFAHVLSLFVQCDVHKVLQVTISQLLDFLIDVASNYTEAPYHNFYHAVDIVTVLYYFYHHLQADHYLTDVDKVFLMIAAICHDIGHPGFGNSFQVNTNTELAKRYGHTSTLETYSVELTKELIEKHKFNAYHLEMNQMIEKFILSTDMIYHTKLTQQMNQLTTNLTSIINRKRKLDSIEPISTLVNKEDRQSLCCILLHAADISNMARPYAVSQQWSNQIVKEFYSQGDEEKKRKMKISPGMDRESCSQRSISLKFQETILPYFKSLVSLLPKSQLLVTCLEENRTYWESNTIESIHHSTNNTTLLSPPPSSSLSTTINTATIVTYKRIRLRYRSQSYPTVLYNKHFIIEKTNLLPLVHFKSSLLHDTTMKNNVESIVLYHPYDI
ncbi:uncharacterized protein BX663DRAFT_495604 [Cokeromyces recurvatus]|uniref:uncharacterized protein n=1 Tax=Cokeromyces recurvatus TaxID=90255 RepID=UPI002220369A|nr:uncharacterized protein BX663DRAFT_495604 [Cokeromyces recurvatus]KAI7907344.1 hypothetical protein BX663DRAFT_495604 [Cokeromyces recurvatus]